MNSFASTIHVIVLCVLFEWKIGGQEASTSKQACQRVGIGGQRGTFYCTVPNLSPLELEPVQTNDLDLNGTSYRTP